MMRFCPKCNSERPVSEVVCEGVLNDAECGWDLSGDRIRQDGWRPEQGLVVPVEEATCTAGHPVSPGDLLCPTCGADVASFEAEDGAEKASAEATEISGWVVVEGPLRSNSPHVDRYRVSKGESMGVLAVYAEGYEPDAEIYDVLKVMNRDHVPEIIETGRWEGRAFEVGENLTDGRLSDISLLANDLPTIKQVVEEVGSALADFGERGIRHRDLKPESIVVRSREPLDLVITGFGSARLSEFDLDIVSPLETTRYTAPETIAGGVAAASDWWSLGIILLEQVTQGACFEGVNDQAFLIHLLTNGPPIPKGLPDQVDLLLRGLLTLDRHQRWGWEQVQAWLRDEAPAVANASEAVSEQRARMRIELGGKSFASPTAYALAAAEPANWEEAKQQLLRGTLRTWATDAELPTAVRRQLETVAEHSDLSDDVKLGLGLKALNPALPLITNGSIVTPGWLLDHPADGYALITGPAPDILEKTDSEPWLSRLKARATRVRERARQLEVPLNEPEFEVHVLSTSRARMAAIWAERRAILPDTDHAGLSALLDRKLTEEEDYILLLSADLSVFRTADAILEEAQAIAERAGATAFDREQAEAWLHETRRDLFAELEQRLEGFARSGIDRVDEWADQFRLERRLSLPRALVLIGIPLDVWQEPANQSYISTLLGFFSKRITANVVRGPLTRMMIAKTSAARVDMIELGTDFRPAAALLSHLILRNDQVIDVDADAFVDDPRIERRLRTLYSHASLYRRDTGIDGLYLGFPFLLMQENRAVRPRIAPVLLWPIKLRPETGARGRVTLAFDRDREEVRLNPAFEPLLGKDATERWREAAKHLLARATLSPSQVMDDLSDLVNSVSGATLQPVPNKDSRVETGKDQLVCAGAVFHLAYVGQAVMEDLRQLQRIPPAGTSLETLLRLGDRPERPEVERPKEEARFFTAASDPSQEQAVLEARSAKGLLIEGPPGTGKSQTIVNIVCDAIGRRKSLLIVCQKQSALEVVYKRLAAEGLSNRIVMVNDVNKDRRPVIQAVREQVEALFNRPALTQAWQQERVQIAARIETLEAELNEHNAALHVKDIATGLSYRYIIGQLIELSEGRTPAIDLTTLRATLLPLDAAGVSALQETIGPLARLWLPSEYEGSVLAHLKPFSADPGTLGAYASDLEAFALTESERAKTIRETPDAFFVEEPTPWRTWSDAHGGQFTNLDPGMRQRLARWLELIQSGELAAKASELWSTRDDLQKLPTSDKQDQADRIAVALSDESLATWLKAADELSTPPTFLQKLSLRRWLRARKHSKFVVAQGLGAVDFRAALQREHHLRPVRERLWLSLHQLGEVNTEIADLPRDQLLSQAAEVAGAAEHAIGLGAAIVEHPLSSELTKVVKAAEPEPFAHFLDRQDQGYRRFEARGLSLAALSTMVPWFDDRWREKLAQAVTSDLPMDATLVAVIGASDQVEAYQRFRPRAEQLSAEALGVFRLLRNVAAKLKEIPAADLDDEVRRILGRESRQAWKARIEAANPVLFLEGTELATKALSLARADIQIRKLNRRLLVEGLSASRLRPLREWEDITRLTGARARRLREFLDRGADLGLMELRPIWLMNPDVASRVLPLNKALFETVVYDEASQMPVEYALPTLYRSKGVIISGDEKQMPPTNFFSSKVENDEADVFEGDDAIDEAGEAERDVIEESWNRREIKDCPDLLQLGKTVLPCTSLQIHYRSTYRELIQFSNAAFYDGRLSVPARHPDAIVQKMKPIQLVRADGVYENQTNQIEAEKVVDEVALYLAIPAPKRPTMGVVTFNRKQADLIEAELEERAESDFNFRAALTQERDRIEGGEDVGFFVKNVENVQGDERDIMIFSSTFGRNKQGAFRRSFGVLGQVGGERRLNVAVTRARLKVVLVTSMPIAEISDMLATRRPAATPRDFLQAYFEYARACSSGELDTARAFLSRLGTNPAANAGSFQTDYDGFQRSVGDYIEALGYVPHPAVDAGAFALDFAIEDPSTGLFCLGVECDAPRHSLLAEARAREMWRPSVLQRSMRAVHRVSSHGWLDRPDIEKLRLRSAIEAAMSRENAA